MPTITYENHDGQRLVFETCPSCDAPIPDGATLRTECPTCNVPYNQLTLRTILEASQRLFEQGRMHPDE